MTEFEAAKLLELIVLAYPSAYRGMDDEWKKATINMWQGSFPDVPYPLMEQAFNHHRMVSKFPPTVAEMVGELKQLYYRAHELEAIQVAMENEEGVRLCRAIMKSTERFTDDTHLGWLDFNGLKELLTGGDGNVQRLGTSGYNDGAAYRLPYDGM